jgi:signal transduction histidine kinase
MLQGQHLFTGAIRDLTQEKEAENRERSLLKQALQNERLADVGAMTARIAHDFGNPLAGVHMTAQHMLRLLSRDPLPVARLTQATETVLSTTRYLDTLVSEFKEFAREQRLQRRDVALPTFLQEILTTWEQEAIGRGIDLVMDVAGTAPVIRADRDKLRRVIDNLVKNALEAVERGPGAVRIAIESETRDGVSILVEDSGPGIPAGMDVFALFATTKPTGTGLGLSICRQIVLAHGGGIEHAPRAPRGTVFRVTLPLRGGRPEASWDDERSPSPHREPTQIAPPKRHVRHGEQERQRERVEGERDRERVGDRMRPPPAHERQG